MASHRQVAPPRAGTARAPRGVLPRDSRRTLLALLAAALGVVPLTELVIEDGWLIDVWITMAIVVLPAAWIRRYRIPSAWQTVLGLVLALFWLTARFVPQHAVLGLLPLGGAWHDVGTMLTQLHRITADESAPVHQTDAVRLALCALLALVAALVDLLAVVARRGALAGVPLLVIFTVSGAVPRHPVSWWLFVITAAAFLMLLGLDSGDDLHRWGHYVQRPGWTARTGAAGAISGQRIAAIAIAVAVLVPLAVPSDSRNVVANLFHHDHSDIAADGLGTTGDGSGGIKPFAALSGQLNRGSPLKLFTVQVVNEPGGTAVDRQSATQPGYLRMNVLSQFTSDGWRNPGTHTPSESVRDNHFAAVPSGAVGGSSALFEARIMITGLNANAPMFANPDAFQGLTSDMEWDAENQVLRSAKVSKGSAYDETFAQPDPTVADLEQAQPGGSQFAQWTQLPAFKGSTFVRTLVASLVSPGDGTYERAKKINDYLTNENNGFGYSLSTEPGDSGSKIVDFLKNKLGFCEQYAATEAVMFRMAGVPARVVLGYTHPVPKDGQFTVTTDDAHAWVEAYFGGAGWVPFDPTPFDGIAGGATNDFPWAKHVKSTFTGGKGHQSQEPSVGRTATVTVPANRDTTAAAAAGAHHGGGEAGPGSDAPWIALGVVLALLLLGLTPAAVRLGRRRSRLRRGRLGDVDALWQELSDTAVDLGYVWSPARTPRQVERWLREPSGTAAGSLGTLASAVERVRFSPQGAAAAGDGRALVQALADVRERLAFREPLGQRLRSRLWPASLGWGRVPSRRKH